MENKINTETVEAVETVVENAQEVAKNSDLKSILIPAIGFVAGVTTVVVGAKAIEFGKKKLADRKAKKAEKKAKKTESAEVSEEQ